jgi:hypothetical protein
MEITLKSLVSFEVTKEDRRYEFVFPTSAPAVECHDVLFEFLAEVAKRANENIQNLQSKQAAVEEK